MTESPNTRRVRWRWAVGICVLATIAIGAVWSRDVSRQDRVLQTIATGLVTLFLLFLWAVLFSRLAGRTRLGNLFAGVVLVGGLTPSLEIKGVSGDLMP